MEILWLAIVFYSIGLGLVLQFRPSLMFHENGTWKEFGYQRSAGTESRHTLFPFWLFSIVWAFASYVLAATITWTLTAPGTAAFLAASSAYTAVSSNGTSSLRPFGSSEIEEETEVEEDNEVEEEVVAPVKRGRGRPKKIQPRAGYYVIDPSSKDGGVHRYVYYGDSPPPEGEGPAIKMNA